jgi:hypothetical protein
MPTSLADPLQTFDLPEPATLSVTVILGEMLEVTIIEN